MVCFQTKIPIWVNFGVSCDGRCWYILLPFGLFDGHMAIFYGFYFIYGKLVFFLRFGKFYQEKSGNPATGRFCLFPEFFWQRAKIFFQNANSNFHVPRKKNGIEWNGWNPPRGTTLFYIIEKKKKKYFFFLSAGLPDLPW
jgi:hypothetical protein